MDAIRMSGRSTKSPSAELWMCCGFVDDVEAMLRHVSSTSCVGLWMMWRLC